MTTVNWMLLVSMGIMVVLMVVELRKLHMWSDVPGVAYVVRDFIQASIRRRLYSMAGIGLLLTYLFFEGLQ